MTDTTKYKFNHSMIRVKDPEASVTFYEHLGMSVLQKFQFPDYKLDLYFLAYDSPKSVSHGKHMSDRQGVLELSYNHDIEKTYNGNEVSGHICVSVDNIQAACKRLSDAGYKFQKILQDDYAFVLDPDEYCVRLIAQNPVQETENVTTTDVQSYKMNRTMLRMKDRDASLKFYEDIFGMTPKYAVRNPEAGLDSYFFGYGVPGGSDNMNGPIPEAKSEGLLELTWNYGTEKKDGMVYHNGNSEPEVFGHICISVDDIEAACERFDKKGVSWQKRLMEGPFRVAFIFDPNGYLVEIIQNERYKPAGHEY